MGQVAVNVNGRSYRFDCGDGEEARLKEIATYVKGRIDALVREYGKVGDERLMLMAALLITDELMDARAALAEACVASAKGAASSAATSNVAASKSAASNGSATTAAPSPAAPSNAAPRVLASAEKREQDAIRAEYRRKMAAGEA